MGRTIVFLVFPDFQILDLTGPLEVFSQAQRMRPGSYTTRVTALEPGPVTASCGLPVLAETADAFRPEAAETADAATGTTGTTGTDTLIVVGGRGTRVAAQDGQHSAWIARTAAQARRTASVCSGAFLLAQAGLLDGRRATTHWQACAELAERFPAVTVDPEPIFVNDGPVWTSAGVTAGIDLALALVEADHGGALARAIARQLVVFVQRPGGQSQFSAQLAAQRPAREPLRRLQTYISEHPDADLSVTTLAAHVGMSERHFARVFRTETGISPAAHVEAVRVETARRLLETTADGLDRIARVAGFGTVATMHRAFRRSVHVTPGDYRARFRERSAARDPR
ncbi:GlxA family transcriptional regulator [Actinocrinis puniceicyclus]|uniref:GlxA family transcriptional regulator n=1 Tax=Actinocrinis puniceicyclus TaxID=977794 RepID=A0A8J7WR81_9ACTN|nr:GlxA family transcriptional regulator [Actinocrinis puniceicyclus]MBS2964080.1 GlxA family transcriptional regulator [Actinocrinis puniceicyclus]